MRKFLFAALLVLGMSSMYGQGVFKAGAVLAIPTGDAAEFSGFGLGADVYYMFGKEDAWLNFGPTVGFRNYFGKEIEADLFGETFSIDIGDVQFLPLAGAFRAKAFGLLNWGTDIGYAVGISDGNDGGFYFRPIVGVDIADAIEVNASYELISLDGGNWNALTFGILFEFGK